MRGLKAAVIGMGILIVVGVTALVVVMVQRMSATGSPNASAIAPAAGPASVALLDEPAGTRIAATSLAGDRLAVQLSGAGPDRVVVVDLRTGRTVARAALAQ